MVWTRFMDMHSGGGSKESHGYIAIEAPEEQAKVIFYNRFGHNPERVTCTCCGEDYSIREYETLREATAYDRGCAWAEDEGWVERKATRFSIAGRYVALDEFLSTDDSYLIIPADDIKPEERTGSVPEQGYVWVD